MLDVARSRSIPIGIYFWPELGRPIGGGPNDALIDRLLARCRRERIPCADLRTDLRGVADRSLLVVNRFDAHGSPLANRLATDAILRRFGPIWAQLSSTRGGAHQTGGKHP